MAESNEPSNALLDLNTKAQRNLKRSDLLNQYTEEETKELLEPYEYDYKYFYEDGTQVSKHDILLCNTRYSERFQEQEEAAAKRVPRQTRKWHPKEDTFLRNTYLYLSDSTIALALNVPKVVVQARRSVLGLSKEVSTSLEVIIWADRDKFDEDIKKFHLTKARPEAFQ